MTKDTLILRNVGPIKKADVTFGDLTVLVGPQATGKSVFLQFLKLVLDHREIITLLKYSGLDWDQEWPNFCDLYFGEGMRNIWNTHSDIEWQGQAVDVRLLAQPVKSGTLINAKSFLVPAQRVLALSRDSWVRSFTDYRIGDPYAVRDFSEKLRQFTEILAARGEELFPQASRLSTDLRSLLDKAIFRGFHLQFEKQGPQRRLVLSGGARHASLPFMVWSAGQREFVPLLLGLYYLMPVGSKERRSRLEWAIIEEPETGLHPAGISAMLLTLLDLLRRGYRVCVSTHSTNVLDLIWALRVLQEQQAPAENLLRLFGVKASSSIRNIVAKALRQDIRVYYFDSTTRATQDISRLDPGSKQLGEAHWGGLTEFSGRVGDIVAEAVSRNGHDI
jgi:hypothetical protein